MKKSTLTRSDVEYLFSEKFVHITNTDESGNQQRSNDNRQAIVDYLTKLWNKSRKEEEGPTTLPDQFYQALLNEMENIALLVNVELHHEVAELRQQVNSLKQILAEQESEISTLYWERQSVI